MELNCNSWAEVLLIMTIEAANVKGVSHPNQGSNFKQFEDILTNLNDLNFYC
ncbi:asl1181 [Nostoc sp. PCC 7120 = FACHB-418]|nr:asl1181 [Nostoc sp. PCC 7120 = FACHB-418]